jgi:hypothetical protein
MGDVMKVEDLLGPNFFHKIVYAYMTVQLGLTGADFVNAHDPSSDTAHLIIRLDERFKAMADRLAKIEEAITNGHK